jgi:hypothetical protein
MASLFRHGMGNEVGFIRRLLESPDALWPRFVAEKWLFEAPLSAVATWSEQRLFVLWLCICIEAWHQRRTPVTTVRGAALATTALGDTMLSELGSGSACVDEARAFA